MAFLIWVHSGGEGRGVRKGRAEPSILPDCSWCGNGNQPVASIQIFWHLFWWNVQEKFAASARQGRRKDSFPSTRVILSSLPHKLKDVEGTDVPIVQARLEQEKHFGVMVDLDPISSFWLLWPEEQGSELSHGNKPWFFNLALAELYIVLCFWYFWTSTQIQLNGTSFHLHKRSSCLPVVQIRSLLCRLFYISFGMNSTTSPSLG